MKNNHWEAIEEFRIDCAIERQEWQAECVRRSKAANAKGVGFLGRVKNIITRRKNARARYWLERAYKVRVFK